MKKGYVPDRNDIIWIDFEPALKKEIGKYRPALVLSSKSYNKLSNLVICSPISTSIRGSKMEVPINNLDQPSVVVGGVVETFSWKPRRAQFIKKAEAGVMKAVLQRLIPLIGGECLL